MLAVRTQPRAWAISLVVASCALVQGLLLKGELITGTPFSIMVIAPDYQRVAHLAFWIGPIASIGLASVVSLLLPRLPYLIATSLTAAVGSPLSFLVVYRLLTPPLAPNSAAPDVSTLAAWSEFLGVATNLALIGLLVSGSIITAICYSVKTPPTLSA